MNIDILATITTLIVMVIGTILMLPEIKHLYKDVRGLDYKIFVGITLILGYSLIFGCGFSVFKQIFSGFS